MAESKGAWPLPDDAPAEADLTRCVHCGLCLEACPTYAITGLETESPRGRIALARAVDNGDIPITATVQQHWDLCLQCRACEAVCPSSVPYGRIMEHARAQVDAQPAKDAGQRRARKFVLRNVVARPRVLRIVTAPARLLARSGLRPLLRRSGVLRLVPNASQLESQLPARLGKPVRAGDRMPAVRDASTRAVLFTGCVMGELFGSVHRSTVRLLARRGVQCEASGGQGCCGALHAHDGDLAFARELARRNVDALGGDDDPIVVNSAGCGAAMKEYGDLLAHDDRYRERAAAFAARVVDLSEYLATLPAQRASGGGERYSYQHACHLAHAQRIREQPEKLLGGIDGATPCPTEGSDMCCGAAGIYSLVQPEMSAQLRARKTEAFRAAMPDIVVTANPGCQMQYEAAVREGGLPARVMHVAEYLDEAETRAAAKRG